MEAIHTVSRYIVWDSVPGFGQDGRGRIVGSSSSRAGQDQEGLQGQLDQRTDTGHCHSKPRDWVDKKKALTAHV